MLITLTHSTRDHNYNLFLCSNAECSINRQLITIVTPTGSALVIVCLLLFSFVCCIKYWRYDRKDIREHNDRKTIELCNDLRKVLRNPRSNGDQKCEIIGHLINFVQHTDEENETIVNGTHNSPSSNTSSSRAGGPPPPTQQVDKPVDNVREPSSTDAVRYDNNKQEISIGIPKDYNKIIAKGPSKKGRKKDKRKPYKKCTREEAIQKAKELLLS